MLSVHFADRFCASKKGGIGGGGRISTRSAMHMAAAFAGCRKAMVGTGLAILTQTGVDKAPLPV